MTLLRGASGYLAHVRLGLAAALAAPAVLVGRCLFFLIAVAILRAFWSLVLAERFAGSLVAELPQNGLTLYVVVTEWIVLSVPALRLRLEDDLRSGGVEGMLLRPQSPLLVRLCEAAGAMIARLVALGSAGLAWLALVGETIPSWTNWPALLLIALLGGIVALLIDALVGATSFWLRRNLPVYMVVQKMSFLFGGLFAPISLYPDWLRWFCELTPFAAHLYRPAALAIDFSPERFAQTLAAELLWIALLALGLVLAWRAGLRRLLANGA